MPHMIISELCETCGDCAVVCPVECISNTGQKNAKGFEYFVIDPDICIDCGACVGVCPIEGAIEDGH